MKDQERARGTTAEPVDRTGGAPGQPAESLPAGSGRGIEAPPAPPRACLREALRAFTLRFPPLYRLWLRRNFGGRSFPLREPAEMPPCAVLRSSDEVERAAREVAEIGLPGMGDRRKFWDALATVGTILRSVPRSGEILDGGAEYYSPVLPWLYAYGYRRLRGCNLNFVRRPVGPIAYERGDVTATPYEDGRFHAMTCRSVIEHGVDPTRFFREMARIARPGALLVVSTDYWEERVETGGRMEFSVPVKVFTRPEIEGLIRLAAGQGFDLAAPVDLACGEKVVSWCGLDYTFLLLTFRKR